MGAGAEPTRPASKRRSTVLEESEEEEEEVVDIGLDTPARTSQQQPPAKRQATEATQAALDAPRFRRVSLELLACARLPSLAHSFIQVVRSDRVLATGRARPRARQSWAGQDHPCGELHVPRTPRSGVQVSPNALTLGTSAEAAHAEPVCEAVC